MNVLVETFASRNFRDFLDFFSFLMKVSAYTFWREIVAFKWKTKFYVIYHNVMHVLSFETSKPFFFFKFFILQGPDIKVLVGI